MSEETKPDDNTPEEKIEIDRKIIAIFSEITAPKNVDMMFTAMLGAAYQSIEGMKSPVACATKVMTEARTLLDVPVDTPQGLSAQAKALQENAVEKFMTWMMAWSETGKKFTGETS